MGWLTNPRGPVPPEPTPSPIVRANSTPLRYGTLTPLTNPPRCPVAATIANTNTVSAK
jgi:hypothetical protein